MRRIINIKRYESRFSPAYFRQKNISALKRAKRWKEKRHAFEDRHPHLIDIVNWAIVVLPTIAFLYLIFKKGGLI